jgi:hypothetical protein
MKANLIIEKIVFAAVIVLLLVVSLLIFISPPDLLEVHSVYQMF